MWKRPVTAVFGDSSTSNKTPALRLSISAAWEVQMPINNFRNITTTGFDEDALFTFTVGDQVRNFAAVTTTGDLANGVYVGADDVSVDNFGRMETSGDGAEGVLIEGDGARVRNFGSILTHGEPTDDFLHFNDAIAVYGDEFEIENRGRLETEGSVSQGVFAEGDGGLIRNFGSISTSGEEEAAALVVIGNGFHVDNRGTLATEGAFSQGVSALGDGGLIRNFGSISTLGFLSHGLVAEGDGNRIVNFGNIRIDDPRGFTPAMDATGSQNEVVNFGTITGGHMSAGGGTPFSGSGNTATNWGTISTDGVDEAMVVGGRDALAQNFGTIDAVAGGMVARGDVGVQVHNSGTIHTRGDFGHGFIVVAGSDGVAVNAGSIRTDGDGAGGVFFFSSLGGVVTNSGSIKSFGGAGGGVSAFGQDVLVQNSRTGSIETHDPDSEAVLLNPTIFFADPQSRLENDGVIKAVQTAVLGGAGDETVINRGRIVGEIELGSGDDTYVAASGGELRGSIFSGDGNDTFVFHDGSGRTQVADFEAGAGSADILDVSAFGFDTFADVLDAARQDGSDLVIRLDRNDQVVLSDVSLGALHENDFLLMA
jgi:hypothetical protein